MLTWCNGFCGGRGNKGAILEKGKGPWHSNDVIFSIYIMKFFWGKRRWRQGKMRDSSNHFFFFSFQNYPFWAYTKKIRTFVFGAWSFLLVHIWFTPIEGSKDFVNWFFKKLDHGCWTIKSDHEKRPYFMVQFHGPWCKLTLIKMWIIEQTGL
jgi:hypothetical protein